MPKNEEKEPKSPKDFLTATINLVRDLATATHAGEQHAISLRAVELLKELEAIEE